MKLRSLGSLNLSKNQQIEFKKQKKQKANQNGNKNKQINLREFACHTTVILAQPRVSRLRAAVVYVDSSGMVGHAWASAEIDRNS